MNIKKSSPSWIFWFRWIFFIGLCWFIGLWIIALFMTFLKEGSPSILLIMMMLTISGLLTSVLLGTVQWLLIRRRVERGIRWLWSTILGLNSGLVIGFLGTLIIAAAFSIMFKNEIDVTTGLTLMGAIAGGITGLMQWRFVLRHQFRPSGWVLINAVSLAYAGYVFGSRIGYTEDSDLVFESVFNVIPNLTFFITVLTGTALVWLLRRSHTSEPNAYS